MMAPLMVMDRSGLTGMTGAEVPPPASDLRKAPLNHAEAGAAGSDESNSSVAGEEDPGAALDVLDPAAAWPAEGWCPWPKERSA
jgi:hypothetical protein